MGNCLGKFSITIANHGQSNLEEARGSRGLESMTTMAECVAEGTEAWCWSSSQEPTSHQ